MARWYISDHAVERYRQRIDPNASEETARRLLATGVQSSARLKGKTPDGHSRYLLQKPACIAIVKFDGPTNVVKTILSTTGDQGRKWADKVTEIVMMPTWTPEHHPDWQDLRNEYRAELPMALLRASTRADVRGPVKAWMGMQ